MGSESRCVFFFNAAHFPSEYFIYLDLFIQLEREHEHERNLLFGVAIN